MSEPLRREIERHPEPVEPVDRSHDLQVRGTDTNDLAVVKAKGSPLAVAGLRSDLRVGDNIAVYGFPLSDRLAATGNFWLKNPNGILVGPSGVVDVGGLVATTGTISGFDNGNGSYTISGAPGGAAVVNQGTITAKPGGTVVLAGQRVANDGVIRADLGTVALGGGKSFALDFYGDRLVRFEVTEAADPGVSGLVENSGKLSFITANGEQRPEANEHRLQ